ncbi:MAG: phosphatidate cytidylyltransferase [Eubacteriales bacterium]
MEINMLKRIITAVVAIAILVPVLFFSYTPVLCIAVAVVSVISLFEMYRCIGCHKKLYLCLPAYVFSVVSPFLIRYLGDLVKYAVIAFICGIVYLLYLFSVIVMSKGKYTFSDGCGFFVSTVYIVTALNSIIYVRDLGESGKYIYLLIFIGAWVTDTFAYFTGYFFGKHKLIPEVSPKKTVEGSIGGIVFCMVSFVVFGIIVDRFFGMNANVFFLAVSGVIVSVVSQIGDLIMSVIKRHYGIKDYGKIFPGHGGMLDRFDSILAVSAMLAAICLFADISGIYLM